MDFSGLVKGVQDFWDFIWPPIFCLIALIGIPNYVAPLTFAKILAKLAALKPDNQRQIRFVKVSKRFGFDKLLPIICAFFLIFFLDVIRNIVVLGGQAMPPVVSYIPSAIVLENHHDSMIQCLWKTRSEAIHLQQEVATKAAASLKDAHSLALKDADPTHIDMRYGLVTFDDIAQLINTAVAEAEAQHKDSDIVKSLHRAEENTGTQHTTFSALKFLFVYTLTIGVIELRRSNTRPRVVVRTFLLLGVIVFGTLGYFLRYLKALEDEHYMKRLVARTYPISGSMRCDAFDDQTNMDLDNLYGKAMKRERSRYYRWWLLQFPDLRIVGWTWEQLKPPEPEPDQHE
ncbi:hypothetical protein JAO29_14720 [Edaphobacter sp. HDX4]|uniref:hypothetical protein n=1 Tax=Edaphobacter sp. HDX4 TaxID=2794064 RepID=UPI002FE5EDDB